MGAYQEELKFAIELVKKASEITEWFRKKEIVSYTKKDQTPVTLADYASQIFITSSIKERFPGDRLIAEESVAEIRDRRLQFPIEKCFNELGITRYLNFQNYDDKKVQDSSRTWTIDPIDGTLGYLENSWYAIGIGFRVAGTTELGIIAVPLHDEMSTTIYIAEKGNGARVSIQDSTFRPISVSNTSELKSTIMCQSLHYNKDWVKELAVKAKVSQVLPMDSMAKFCKIARGIADFYIKHLDPNLSFSWDFVPGEILVKEAGGEVSDLNGVPLKFKDKKLIFSSPGIVASNGILHEKIIKLIYENRRN